MKKSILAAACSAAALLLPVGATAEPVIEIEDPDRIRISAPQDDVSTTLNALAARLGFSISGRLEQPGRSVPIEQHGSPADVITQLVSPQSVAIIFGETEDGASAIRRIELLDTGTQEADFSRADANRTAPLTGSQDRIEHRIRHNERRAMNRAKRLQEGTLIWTEEGRRKHEEKKKHVEQQQPR